MSRIWLIGASEGIGRALAVALASNNLVVASARNASRLNELALLNKNITPLAMDVCNEENIKEACENLGNIDQVIYCAGTYQPMSAKNIDLIATQQMFNTNLVGIITTLHYILPIFLAKSSGCITLISSVAGYRGLPNSFAYGASKAAVIHLAENLQCDLANTGIKVQVINPGFVKTRLTDLNDFAMPFIISAEQAAAAIIKIMDTNKFEAAFPWTFALILKFMNKLPYWLYFKLINVFIKPHKH
jgi:short-subunit dehydrogenase